MKSVKRYYSINESHNIRFATMNLHLLQINLAHIKNLIYKCEHTLSIPLYNIYIALIISSISVLFQLFQRPHNQCQRRAYIMSGVYKKLHLLLFVLSFHAFLFIAYKSQHSKHKKQQINYLCKCSGIPWCLDGNLQRGYLAKLTIHQSSYLQLVAACTHITKGKRVITLLSFVPHAVFVKTILIGYILGMYIIKHRQLHGETCATCRNSELTLTEINSHIVNKKPRQRNNMILVMLTAQISRIKHHSSPITTKNKSAIGKHKGCILYILFCLKSVSLQITCKRMRITIVMPYTFRSTHPCITHIVKNNAVYLQIIQSISTLHAINLVELAIIIKKSVVSTYNNVSPAIFTTAINKLMG